MEVVILYELIQVDAKQLKSNALTGYMIFPYKMLAEDKVVLHSYNVVGIVVVMIPQVL